MVAVVELAALGRFLVEREEGLRRGGFLAGGAVVVGFSVWDVATKENGFRFAVAAALALPLGRLGPLVRGFTAVDMALVVGWGVRGLGSDGPPMIERRVARASASLLAASVT